MMTKRRVQSLVRGFTLIELLVVMGILVVLAVLTGIGVSQVSREARLSSGVNQVVAALGSARAYAIKNNTTVMLGFVVYVDRENLGQGEIVEMILGRATGEITTRYGNSQRYDQRFVPVPGLPAVQLPRGIKVAGPLNTAYSDAPGGAAADRLWVTQPGGEWRIEQGEVVSDEMGRMFGVMFGPDGTMITRNVQGAGGSGAVVWPYLDADRNSYPDVIDVNGYGGSKKFTVYDAIGDECDLHPVQWLGVFDDEALRRARNDANWGGVNGEDNLNSAITGWVDQYGVPIFFNRYTGVAEVTKP